MSQLKKSRKLSSLIKIKSHKKKVKRKSKKNLNRVSNKIKKSIKKGGMDTLEVNLSLEDQENIQTLYAIRDSLKFSEPLDYEVTNKGIEFNYKFAKKSGKQNLLAVVSNILYIKLLLKESSQLGLTYSKLFFEEWINNNGKSYDLVSNFLKVKEWMDKNIDKSKHIGEGIIFELLERNNDYKQIIRNPEQLYKLLP